MCSLARRMYSEALLLAGSAADPVLSAHVLEKPSMLSSHAARKSAQQRPGPGRSSASRPGSRGGAPRVLCHASRRSSPCAARTQRRCSVTSPRSARRLPGAAGAGSTRRVRRIRHGSGSSTTPRSSTQEAVGHQNLGDPATASLLHRASLDAPGLSRRNRACGQASARCGAGGVR